MTDWPNHIWMRDIERTLKRLEERMVLLEAYVQARRKERLFAQMEDAIAFD